MSDADGPVLVDAYLSSLDEAQRRTLDVLRHDLLALIPRGDEGMSYLMPCIRENGKALVGYAAFRKHCSLFPHSGSVLKDCTPFPDWCDFSKGTLRFPIGERLPRQLLRRIIAVKRRELSERA